MRFCPGRAIEIHLHSQDRERRDIKHKITMVQDTRKPNYGSQESSWFDIWFTMTLYYKMRQKLLQNANCILLQNTTKIYYKMR